MLRAQSTVCLEMIGNFIKKRTGKRLHYFSTMAFFIIFSAAQTRESLVCAALKIMNILSAGVECKRLPVLVLMKIINIFMLFVVLPYTNVRPTFKYLNFESK